MARTVKEKEYAVRRNEILDAAQRLIYTRGYDQMAIQDVLDDLKISKGAFYHYFNSKQDLLEAMIEHLQQVRLELLIPIVQDPAIPALEKLQRIFNLLGRYKTDQKDLVLAVMHVWYSDHNAIVRQKEQEAALRQVAPLIAQIIRQGVTEGTMTAGFPDQAAGVILALLVSVGDAMAGPLLSDRPPAEIIQTLGVTIAAYNEALERVLGIPAASLKLVADLALLKEWVN